MRIRFFVPLLAAGVTISLVPGSAAAAASSPSTVEVPQPGSAGVGDELHPGLGNGGYMVRHYDLALRFSEGLKGYAATTTLQGRSTTALSRFNLDLAGPRVQSVAVDGHKATWSRSGDELQVKPAKPIYSGRNFTVQVKIKASVPDIKQAGPAGHAIVRSEGFIQTGAQPSFAHQIAAFADHPAQKAPATITIAAPSRLNSIANGELTTTHREDAYTVRRFESRQRLAPELIQIGVGPFIVVKRKGPDGINLRYAVPNNQVNEIMPKIDKVVPEILRFATKRFGPFPLPTYGIYFTPTGLEGTANLPQGGGALETQSLTLMHPGLPEGLIAHEIVHEYFGNSVSPRQWSDLWLNEGFGYFYNFLWEQENGGKPLEATMKPLYQMLSFQLSRQGPIAAPKISGLSDDEKGRAPFDSAANLGGAVVLYALQQEVGDATLQRIERAWVNKHRDSVATTTDFIRLASREAGRDLKPFLDSWLYSEKVPAMPGHPDWKPAPRQPSS